MAIVMAMLLLATTVIMSAMLHMRRREKKKAVAFFHPYTRDGGGGERVLWCAVKAVQELAPHLTCTIYTGDADTSHDLAQRAVSLFGIRLLRPVSVVKLERRKWIEAECYPHFTLLGQSFGSIILAWEALRKFTPMVFVDTAGYAFAYPMARACGCKVVCYTHYPTISFDMLSRVIKRNSMYNNNSIIARNFLLTVAKTFYYMLVAVLYGLAGRCSNIVMVNSSWTQAHIEKLWRIPSRIVRIYPPCDTISLQALPIARMKEHCYLISVAQFRPEKNHYLQLEAFAASLERLGYKGVGDAGKLGQENLKSSPRLKLVGSCRNSEDHERLEGLKRRCQELGIQAQVDFYENVTYVTLKELLGGAIAGLHSMIDEHFGISVVEYMAAGAIPIAHNSAGPKADIVVDEDGQQTGFLATTKDEYAEAICKVLLMSEEERLKMAKAARQRSSRFSLENFDRNFKVAISSVL